MVLEYLRGLMEDPTEVNGLKACNMEQVIIQILQGGKEKGYGKMVKKLNGLMNLHYLHEV